MAKAKPQSGAPSVRILGNSSQLQETDRVAWRFIRCAEHHFDVEPCTCAPGPQYHAYLAPEFEVGLGGGRGGMKSESGRAFLIKGNPVSGRGKNGTFIGKKPASETDVSYINNPRYRALVLRKNQVDLADWIERARGFFAPMGGIVSGQPAEIRFPSGASFLLGHMADSDSYEKYQGQEFHRILLEELTQIPQLLLYLRIIMSCRSTFSELVPQVFCTFNPGGAGHGWVASRFVNILDSKGRKVPPRTPYTDPETGQTRVFIFSKVTDNPYLMWQTRRENGRDIIAKDEAGQNVRGSYYRQLQQLPDIQRRAWLDGDFDSMSGNYFTLWRPNGPMEGEQIQWPWARHVTQPINLMPYWTRWIAIDWGFKHYAIVLWGCQHPNGQVHIYRELAFSGMSPEQLGVELALASIKDLEGQENHSMMLALSPDAFGQRTDALPISDQIKAGICAVLGEKAAYVIPTEAEKAAGGGEHKDFFQMREFQTKQAGIGIKRAENSRIAGWMYMHSLMRFKPLISDSEPKFDRVYAEQLAMDDATKYFQYCHAFDRAKEALPILQIWDTCPMLIAAIPTAMHDEDRNPEDVRKTSEKDDDLNDTCRYLLMHHKHAIAQVPLKQFVQDRIAKSYRQDEMSGNALFQIAERAERDYAHSGTAKPFSVRRSSSRKRVN